MKIIRDTENCSYKNAVVAIGNFDWLHVWHRAVIEHGRRIAKGMSLPLAVMSFEPHPKVFFSKNDDEKLRIYSLYDKLLTLKNLGVDIVYLLRFNARFSNLTAQEFVEQVLVRDLAVSHVLTGDDFCFGKGRAGDCDTLYGYALEHHFGYSVQKKIAFAGGEEISSSKIRNALKNGDMQQASRLLGQNYHITGRVTHGEKRGQEIGFPTANIPLAKLFIPRFGVYAVRVLLGDKKYNGVANIGVKPTFGVFSPQLEVHLFDFSGDLYGQHICVELVEFIRDEQKFPNFDALKNQIEKDAIFARRILQ